MSTSPPEFSTSLYEDDAAAALAQLARRDLPKNPVAFYGSSSFRLWTRMAEDLGRLDIVNLGFGGGTCRSGEHYLDRLLVPSAPRNVVLYFGENDISNDGLAAPSAFGDLRQLCTAILERLPAVPVFVLSAKQSPTKWIYADEVSRYNALVEDYCAEEPRLRYVDVTSILLGEHGRPISRDYVADLIHLSPLGYAKWARILRAEPGLFHA